MKSKLLCTIFLAFCAITVLFVMPPLIIRRPSRPITSDILSTVRSLSGELIGRNDQVIGLRFYSGCPPYLSLRKLFDKFDELESLNEVSIEYGTLGQEQLSEIIVRSKTKALLLHNVRFNGALFFSPQQDVKKLDHLELDGCIFSHDRAPDLTGALSLSILVCRNMALDDDFIRTLASLPKLQLLDLSGTQISSLSIETLASFPSLKRVIIKNTNFTSNDLHRLEQLRPDIVLN